MWRGINISFRDMLFLLVFAYLVIGAVALAHVRKQQEETSGATPPGAVIVDLRWDEKVDADVDLWVEAPGDVPVGYSNKAGMIFNLLRDDLGHSGDPNSMNYEVAYGRGRWPGEYTVNAHLYRSAARHLRLRWLTLRQQVAPRRGEQLLRAPPRRPVLRLF